MCLSEVYLPVSVLPSWRVHTCFCSLWARNETSLLFAPLCFGCHTETFTSRSYVKWIFFLKNIQTWTGTNNRLVSSLSGCIIVFELWFWWKTPESEDSLISHTPNKGVCTTLCHYWKREGKKCGPQGRMEGDSLFSFISAAASSSVLSYRGFPSLAFCELLSFLAGCMCVFWVRHTNSGGCLRPCEEGKVPRLYWIFYCLWVK